jgi:hypothetical protein
MPDAQPLQYPTSITMQPPRQKGPLCKTWDRRTWSQRVPQSWLTGACFSSDGGRRRAGLESPASPSCSTLRRADATLMQVPAIMPEHKRRWCQEPPATNIASCPFTTAYQDSRPPFAGHQRAPCRATRHCGDRNGVANGLALVPQGVLAAAPAPEPVKSRRVGQTGVS